MRVTRFDPHDSLIIVHARIWGPRGPRGINLAFDTAATLTQIVPEVLDDLGYSARDGVRPTTVSSAIGEEPGYLLRVSKFSALGFTASYVSVNVQDLPDNFGIQGLLGLSFLHQLNYEVRSAEGRILAERI